MEAAGGPLGATIAAANVQDTKLLAAPLEAIGVERPQPTTEVPQSRCLDKDADHPTGHETGATSHDIPHSRRGVGWWNGRWPDSLHVVAASSAMRRRPSIS